MSIKKLPGVLSFQRGLIISDATFHNLMADGSETPVNVIRHGIRGTQNVEKKKDNVSNPQTTDTAKLASDATGLVIRFSVGFTDLGHALFACAPAKADPDKDVAEFRQHINSFIEKVKKTEGLNEVSRRFARNIANGRWLWRNRVMARAIEVTVKNKQETIATFDALATSLTHFDSYQEGEITIAKLIADGFRGDAITRLTVEAKLDFGMQGAIEVFPSQNYVENKPRGFARPLYCLGKAEPYVVGDGQKFMDFQSSRIMGQAALRDQKIGNALRTIDTWYDQYETHGKPIPVEPNGANLDAQKFFRNDKKSSAFDIAKQLDTLEPDTNDGMFMIASLIRGGVYSGGKE